MSLLGGITDLIFGKPEAPEADMDTIIALMQQGDLYSNPNQNGLFGGWRQEIGEDGRLTQSQFINPEVQPAMDSFLSRLNQGPGDDQLSALKNAAFEARMSQQGPMARPPQRQRPMNRSQLTDDEGNSIAPADWWRDKQNLGY